MNQSTLETVREQRQVVVAPPRLLARNSALNLLSEVWSSVVLLVGIPVLVRALGETSFGLFSLAWVVIGYLMLLDVGVSRGATKFVSEHLALNDIGQTRTVVRAAIICNCVLGIIGSTLIVAFTPLLVKLFKMPPELRGQVTVVFYCVAICIPMLLLQGSLRGVLSSLQAFGWMNAINMVAITLQWGLACGLAVHGSSVSTVVVSTAVVRGCVTAGYLVLLLGLRPELLLGVSTGFSAAVRRLLRFGSWVSVSQLVSPLLVYLDRLFIASYLSLASVTLYTVPNEAITRLRILPASMVTTLFPAFSERSTVLRDSIDRLYGNSLAYLSAVLLPVFAFIIVFARDILSVWMGPRFSASAWLVMEVMAFGALMNCLAYVPYTALQALGRPDVTGKFHLLEVPVYVAVCFALIPRFGIVGAAAAGAVRFLVDSALLFGAARRLLGLRLSLRGHVAQALIATAVLCAAMLGARFWLDGALLRAASGLVLMALYFCIGWLVLRHRLTVSKCVSLATAEGN
jgi:O-antigen/teichoic acid export membrane protein